MITGSVQKSQKPLFPPCGLNDKSLTGHDITRDRIQQIHTGIAT
ncbi:hypothetical protein [Nostoc sp.]